MFPGEVQTPICVFFLQFRTRQYSSVSLVLAHAAPASRDVSACPPLTIQQLALSLSSRSFFFPPVRTCVLLGLISKMPLCFIVHALTDGALPWQWNLDPPVPAPAVDCPEGASSPGETAERPAEPDLTQIYALEGAQLHRFVCLAFGDSVDGTPQRIERITLSIAPTDGLRWAEG